MGVGLWEACWQAPAPDPLCMPPPTHTHFSPPRFGPQGVRVFQLLMTRGQLEQKQVAEQTMGPQKETRELLYR